MEKVVALQQHFPYKSSKFSENSSCRINFNTKASNLAILLFSMPSFYFWHYPSYPSQLQRAYSL